MNIKIELKDNIKKIPVNFILKEFSIEKFKGFFGIIKYENKETGSIFYENLKNKNYNAIYSRLIFIDKEYRNLGITTWIVNNYYKKINSCVIAKFTEISSDRFLNEIGAVYDEKHKFYITNKLNKI